MADRTPYRPGAAPLPCFTAAAPAFSDGSDTPRDFLERCLDTLEAREADVRAFVCHDLDAARTAADDATARWRDGRPLSPLDGCPVGVKDIIETRDLPTQMGSPIFEDWESRRDAACVQALRTGGAIIVGKTVTTEFAFGVPGPTRNPFDLSRTPGGSSSGSAAAVGAGMLPLALGTQTGGSVLRPASFCANYALKLTHGALNIGGVHPISASHDHLGTMAGSLADAWAAAVHIGRVAGGTGDRPGLSGDYALPAARKPQRLIRIKTVAWDEIDGATEAEYERFVTGLAAEGVEILDETSHPDIAALEASLREVEQFGWDVTCYEGRWPFSGYAKTGKLSDFIASRMARIEAMSPADFATAVARRDVLRAQVDALVSLADGFVTLGSSSPAPVGHAETGSRKFLLPWTVAGAPAYTLPLMAVDGLPLGIQVMGFRNRDTELAAIARWMDGI
jgi:Asp-tRNA(Asn)/Glu-tRNA(Gln) amidotransferase A subunit family amidase